MVVADVYQGLGDAPRGSIKQLRIVQLLPKSTPWANTPPVGIASEENGRAILGTVPVEEDGSARFLVPAMTPIYFQALDADGFAYQTMRSLTYVQPGERVSCVGCHEARMSAPVRKPLVALGRPPSTIEPGPLDGVPFSFVRSVQPILDKHCVSCHGAEKPDGGIDLTGAPHEGFTRAYRSLCGSDRDFWADGTNPGNAAKALVPRFGGRNQIQITPPGGMYGALGSRLIRLVRDGHQNVKLSPDELRRLATWIDLNAIFYGVNDPDQQAGQLRGEVVPMPEMQ
jgi:cytochrome c553